MTVRQRQVLVVSLGVLISSVMVVLGLWQMQVFQGQGRVSAEDLAKQPAVELSSQIEGETDAAQAYGRTVTITGKFVADKQFYVGDGFPLRVATAFELDSGQVVVVVRGQLGFGDDLPVASQSPVSLKGVFLPSENEPDRGSLPGQDLPPDTIPKLRLAQVAQNLPSPLLNGYVTLDAASASTQQLTAAPVTLPQLPGRARNGGYALQWWVFAASALVFSVVIARSFRNSDGGPGRG